MAMDVQMDMAQSSPAPTPSRANYGFVLYLGSRSAVLLYLIWALLPEPALSALGLSYLPQKYWAVAVPVHFCTSLALFAFLFYPGINFLLTPDPSDPRVLSDPSSIPCSQPSAPCSSSQSPLSRQPIPKVSDLSWSHVSRTLYLHSS